MSRITQFHRRGAGFTVIELLMTMTIAAILLAIAVPSFRGTIASNRLVTQTNDLIGAMNFARSEAITRNRTITFCRADADGDTACSAAAGDWAFWIVRNAAGEVSRRGELPPYGGAMRVTSTLTLDRIDFGSDGLARTSGGALLSNQQIAVCSTHSTGDNRRAIALGGSSRVSVSKSTSAGVC